MLALLAADPFAYGPFPGPLRLDPQRARHPWRVPLGNPNASGPAFMDLTTGLLAFLDAEIVWLDPRTGRVRWRAPRPREGFPDGWSPSWGKGGSDGRWIVLVASRWDEKRVFRNSVLVLDARSGRRLSLFDAREGVDAGRVRIEGDRIVLERAAGAEAYGLDGISRGLLPPRPASLDGFGWKGGRVEWVAYEDYPMDGGDANALNGVRYVVDGQDAWGKRYLRRDFAEYSGRGSYREDRPLPADTFSGGNAVEFFVRAVCADEGGVWALRRVAGKGQLVRLRPSGMVDQTPQPYADVRGNLPAWTAGGIVYAYGETLYRFDGRASRRIAALPDPQGIYAYGTLLLTRWGVVRASRGTLRLDPVAD